MRHHTFVDITVEKENLSISITPNKKLTWSCLNAERKDLVDHES